MSAIVERFLSWSSAAPVARRCEAAAVLARAYLVSPLSADERDQVEAAMTVLLDDPALEVRRALAETLARSELTPGHIVLSLSADKDCVAVLVAEHSPLLLDSELVDLVATRDEAVQIAVASRPFVSRALSAAIGEVATAAACRALVTNPGARVPRFTLDRIVARHGGCPELRLALLERDDLPLDVRGVLLGKLAGALCDLIVSRDWMAPEKARAVTDDARELATIASAFEAPAESMPALVEQLIESNALTPAFLIRAVASGQTTLFESALAALSGVPRARVGALVASGRAASLAALLAKARLPERTFPAFTAAIEVLRADAAETGAVSDYRRATRLIDAIVARYQKRRDRELDTILALLRRFAREAKRAAARDYAEQLREAA